MSSLEYMLSCIRRIYESDHYFSYNAIWKTCSIVEELMRDLGMIQVKTYAFPSDGVTDFGGWLMPLGWDPKHAVLNVVFPGGTERKICSYAEVPCSLMLYSRSADVTAEMVFPDAEDVAGKIVLFADHQVQMQETMELVKRGAVGVACSCLKSAYLGKPGFEYLNDTCQWCNYQIPFWPTKENPFGFSLSPNQGHFLQELKRKNGKVVLHAKLEAEVKPGNIPVVSGLLPGDTEEEIVLTGHLFEQGANDNASGIAESLAIVRDLAQIKRKRGIRLLFTHEAKSLQAYANSLKIFPKMVAGLNLDMVGVSLDRVASIGDGAPSYPTFATPLIKHFLEKYGCKAQIGQISGNDASFCEPFFGTAMLTLEFMSDPNYHKSSDTPDKIDPVFLETTFQLAKEYVAFLVNAGLPEAFTLAKFAREYDLEQGTACRIANQRLDSIKSLINDPEERKQLEAFLHLMKADFELEKHSEEPVSERMELLRTIVPVKQYRGYFSFEKFWFCENSYPEISSLLAGWSAPIWVDDAMIWSDGSRNGEKILRMVNIGRTPKISADLFYHLLVFMKQEGYITWEGT